jgi:hypothetical protein
MAMDDGTKARSAGSVGSVGSAVYKFCLEDHIPQDHHLRSIGLFGDLLDIRSHLAPFSGSTGQPSIAPKLLIRMLQDGEYIRAKHQKVGRNYQAVIERIADEVERSSRLQKRLNEFLCCIADDDD